MSSRKEMEKAKKPQKSKTNKPYIEQKGGREKEKGEKYQG